MDWGVADVFKIIALYRQYPCLWEYRSADYKRVDLKRNAWEEIGKEMNKGVDEVKKKIKYLRSAYVGEKKKAEASKSSGSGADDVYKPHLFYYTEFSFLDSVIVLRSTSSNLPKESYQKETLEVSPDVFIVDEVQEHSQNCSQDSSLSTSTCSMSTSTPLSGKQWKAIKRARLERDNKFNDALDAIVTKVTNTNVEHETMFSAFAKSIAMQLAELPLVAETDAMAEIQKMLALKVRNASRSDVFEAAMYDADIVYQY